MFKKMLCGGLLGLAALSASSVQAADVTLMPVNVRLDRSNDRATVQVMNNGTEAVVMQAEAISWQRVDGVDRDGPTSDVIVNPPVFTVQPGQTQIVRVGLRRGQELEREATYRMVLREVPTPLAAGTPKVSGSVRVLVALRVPIYVAPAKVQRSEAWQLQRDSGGHLVASVSNTGNVHLKVAELRVQGTGTEGYAIEQGGPQSVIFPGEQRSFRLKKIEPAETRTVTVQIRTDQGVQQLAFNER